jgi:hypothetical protein
MAGRGRAGAGRIDSPGARRPATSRPALGRLDDLDASAAGEALDALALEVFGGEGGRARLAPLIERFDREVGKLDELDPDYAPLQLVRMDWALCDATIPGGAPGETWAWRVAQADPSPLRRAAARSLAGLFEVFPGKPTWVRDRVSGVVLRVLDGMGPWAGVETGPAALWELRLLPDDAGGFRLARPPIDYSLALLELLERELPRRFASARWPSLQTLRRARLHHRRGEGRTPITKLLMVL